MVEDLVEFQDEDFEFADAPMSKDFLIHVFNNYELKFIAYFGGDFFYVEMVDGEPFVPIYGGMYYVDEVELIMDFMVKERINIIRYEEGTLLKNSSAEVPDLGDL
ncbi:hypothetical protein V7O62_00150 [Methanolobus sp. ZRKC2]|uniref:hypothetical protein n=1 Tax=Methanolobus sp. ZRKC2 TaxID=3125783 RepID=UPI00324BB153